MKIRIEVDGSLSEPEVLIRCCRMDDAVQELYRYLLQRPAENANFSCFKDGQEYYLPVETILFFETEGDRVYAHTADDCFRIKHRLYELEMLLPKYFVRAAKSAILNIRQVYSINRNITSASLVTFYKSPKHVYISRHYYKQLKQRLEERNMYEK